MAGFVEQATLLLNDRSTADIKRVNAALRQLFATSQRMKNMRINLGITPTAISRAKQLAAALAKLSIAAKSLKGSRITPTISSSAINKIRQLNTSMRQLHALQAKIGPQGFHLPLPTVDLSRLGDIRKATAVLIRYAAALRLARNQGGGSLPRLPTPGGGGVGAGGGGNQSFFSRFGPSLLGSFVAFTALTRGANLAAAALRGLAVNAAERDRTKLLIEAGATPAQQAIINAAQVPAGTGPIRFTDNERRQLIQSLLGDVQAPEGLSKIAAQEFKARAAVQIAAALEQQVLPRQFALKPTADIKDVQEGLRMLVKSMNLGSTEITDASGKLSNEGLRVLNAAVIAMAADPELTPELIKTTMANLKTAAFSMTQDDLTRVLLNAGARGSRAGHEAFRAQQMLLGQVDNKTLNNALAAAGLLENVKRNKQGNVVTSSGTVVEEDLFQTDFNAWLGKHVIAPMSKALGANATNAQQVAFLNKMFAGAPAAGKQGLIDFVLGDKQMTSTMGQAKDVFEQDIGPSLEQSWTAQFENLSQAANDAAAAQGELIANTLDLAGAFGNLAQQLRTGITANTKPFDPNDPDPLNQNSLKEFNPGLPAIITEPLKWLKSFFGEAQAAGGPVPAGAGAQITARREKIELAESKTRLAEAIQQMAVLEARQQARRDAGVLPSPWTGGKIVGLQEEITSLNATISQLSATINARGMIGRTKDDLLTKLIAKSEIIPEDTRLSANRTLRNIKSKANKDEVLAFQKRMGLKEDGIVGRATRRAMKEASDKFTKAGVTIDQIKKIQQDAAIKVDGIVGPQTEQAIALQGWSQALDQILKDGGGVNIINWPAAMLQDLTGTKAPGTGGANSALIGIQDKRDNRFSPPPENFSATAEPTGGSGTLLGGAVALFDMAFGAGATKIADAGTQAASSVESGLAAGGAGAGQTIAGDMISAASQVGAIIANAVRSAAAGISVNVNATGGGHGLDIGRSNAVGARPGGPI